MDTKFHTVQKFHTMKRALLTIPALLLVTGIYLAILLALVRVTLLFGNIPAGVLHVLARCGELALAVTLLLSGTFVATRTAVWIFRPVSSGSVSE